MPNVKFSNQYPYTDFHELNLDWVIKEVKYWSTKVGKTIQSIELTGTVGLVDTYTINYSDGSTSTFDVTNGNGIASVAKTGTAGLVDTYTITFQDGSTTTFEVTNGAAAVDPTLTLSDYAADAKVTGDRITAIDNIQNQNIDWFNRNVALSGNLLPYYVERVEDVYVNDMDGKLVYTPQAGYVSYIIPIKKNTTYSLTYGRFLALLDADQETLIGSRSIHVTTFNSGTASYVAFSFAVSDYPEATYKINAGVSLTDKNATLEINGLRLIPTIVVDQNGNGDYTTLTAAVADASSGDVIYVCKGVYQNEIVEAWGKNITIIGESPYNTIIENDLDDYFRPPLEMAIGSLYNIQFFSKGNVTARHAYALHIDDDSQLDGTFYAENVIFKTEYGSGAVGAGMRRNCIQCYRNCIFENDNGPAFFGNESTQQQAGGISSNQYYKFYNCTFKNGIASSVVSMRGTKSNGTTVYCTFVGCSFMDDGSTLHPAFRMDYTSPDYMGTSTVMGDMGIINWNLDIISTGNTVPGLNAAKEGEMYIVP